MNSENLNFEIRSLQSEEANQIRILININEDYFKKFAVRNSNFNIRHYWAWDVMNTITAFYNMFERFLPCAKSNLHVLRQKMRDFYNNVMKKKYRKKNVSVCWEMWGVSVCVVIVVINFFTTQFAYKKRNFFSNFFCGFLNPNYFFQFLFLFF